MSNIFFVEVDLSLPGPSLTPPIKPGKGRRKKLFNLLFFYKNKDFHLTNFLVKLRTITLGPVPPSTSLLGKPQKKFFLVDSPLRPLAPPPPPRHSGQKSKYYVALKKIYI